MTQKCGIDGKRFLGCHYNKRLMGFSAGNELMYQEIVKQATGTEIEITDTKNDTGRIAGVEFASSQVTRSGKNLLKLYPRTGTSNGITYTINADGSVDVNGTATGTVFINLNAQTGYYFTLTNGQVYTSYLKNIQSSIRLITRSNSQNRGLLDTDDNVESRTQTYIYPTDTECWSYIRISSGKTVSNLKLYPMIVKGSSAGEFEPYEDMLSPDYPSPVNNTGDGGILNITSSNGTVTNTYPITLPVGYVGGSLPNGVKDTYELIDGEWKFVQRVGRVVLNGSESGWFLSTVRTNTLLFILHISDSDNTKGTSSLSINCDRLVSTEVWEGDVEGIRLQSNNRALMIGINKSRLVTQDVAGFETWLASNPITVYYELATPIIHNASDILINTYSGYNKIECTNAVKPTLTVKYLEK